MRKIGRYFSLEELIKTNTGIDNQPSPDVILRLKYLVDNILDPAREAINEPIYVTSGYRSTAVNRKIGGSSFSQHLFGEAADLNCSNNRKLFETIRDTLVFDQLIWEGGDDDQPEWVHVSYKLQGNRGEILRAKKVEEKNIYTRL